MPGDHTDSHKSQHSALSTEEHFGKFPSVIALKTPLFLGDTTVALQSNYIKYASDCLACPENELVTFLFFSSLCIFLYKELGDPALVCAR